MKILVTATTFPRWAKDTEPDFVYQLSKRLNQQHEVHILAPHTQGAASCEELSGLKVHRFKYAPTKWQKIAYNGGINANLEKNKALFLLLPLFFIAQIAAIIRLQRKHQYQCIHAHWIIPQGLTAVFARYLILKNKPKILLTSHGGDLYSLKGKITTKVKSWILKHSDHISVVSSAMKSYLMEKHSTPKEKISVAPMGVDLKNRFQTEGRHWKQRDGIIFVGRLVEKKGVEFLIRAFAKLGNRLPTHLTIVGDGPLKSKLQKLTKELSIDKAVFTGAIENKDLPSLLNQHRIAVIPSIIGKNGDQEGLGLTIIEAMGASCLTICSDLPAIRDIINHGHNGLLFEPSNHGELANLIEENYYTSTRAETLAKQGCEDVNQHFDWSLSTSRYEKILEKLKKTI